MSNRKRVLAALLLLSAARMAEAAEPAWKPERNVEIIIAAAAAGANDRIGRAIQRVLQETRLVPTSVSVANKPGGGQNIGAAYLNSHAGDPHYLMLASAQIAGGHVDVGVSSPGSARPLADSGKLRIFAVAGPKRLGAPFADIPTFREQGIDVIAPVFYVMLAPKGIGAAPLAYWEDALMKVTRSAEIQKDMEQNLWSVEPVIGKELMSYLDQQHESMRRALVELGLAK